MYTHVLEPAYKVCLNGVLRAFRIVYVFSAQFELKLLQYKLGTHLLQTIAGKTESDLIQEMYNSLYLKSMDIFSTIT